MARYRRPNPLRRPARFIGAVILISLLSLTGFSGVGNGKATQADQNHPNIHQKVGNANGRANANPNGNGNGGQIHGIGNVPGQSGNQPGVDNLRNVHGGLCSSDGGPNPAC